MLYKPENSLAKLQNDKNLQSYWSIKITMVASKFYSRSAQIIFETCTPIKPTIRTFVYFKYKIRALQYTVTCDIKQSFRTHKVQTSGL